MADHHAEQVMDAFTTSITGLATTGLNVIRDHAYDVDSGVAAALSVYQGSDEPVDESSWPFIDSELTIYTDVHASVGSSVPISQTLNQIRKEMVVAVMADYTLGLAGIVHEIEEGIASEPEIEPGDKPIAFQRVEWKVMYRRSVTDPSV